MPSRATASAATEIMEVEVSKGSLPGLQFKEDLSWRVGKSLAIADLLRRLQALHKEMRDMEQEEDERDSFTRVANDLASPNLLAHKDKGVKAWTACCLVDILRLCAPDAPYTGQQLKVSRHHERSGPSGRGSLHLSRTFSTCSSQSSSRRFQTLRTRTISSICTC